MGRYIRGYSETPGDYGIEPQPVDKDGTTCPYVMTYPASPHLAAEIDKVTLDMERITVSTRKLDALYDMVLLEEPGTVRACY